MINRKQIPTIIEFLKQETPILKNCFLLKKKIPFYLLNMSSQALINIDLIFESGSWNESKVGEAFFCSKMLLEGTTKKKSYEISEMIDFFGGTIAISSGVDHVQITTSCLNKFLSPMLEILVEILSDSNFPEERLSHIKNLKKKSIQAENLDIMSVAKKQLREMIFSAKHPYGKSILEKNIEDLRLEDTKNYFQKKLFKNPKIFISGSYSDSEIEQISNLLNYINFESEENSPVYSFERTKKDLQKSIRKESTQSAICLGREVPLRSELDGIKIRIANIVLGGYFGSRLMKNIREKNGYTYGIHSRVINFKNNAMLMISSEIKKGFEEKTFEQIYLEIEKLQKEPLPDSELKNVKKYIMGTMKLNMDNPFSVMEKLKDLKINNICDDFYEKFQDDVFSVTQSDIMEVVNKYFSKENISSVVVN